MSGLKASKGHFARTPPSPASGAEGWGGWEEQQMSWRAKLLFAAAAWFLAGALPAAAYPDRPVTIVVPFAAGGPSDIIPRIIREHLSPVLGQQFVVENVPGAGATLRPLRLMPPPPHH